VRVYACVTYYPYNKRANLNTIIWGICGHGKQLVRTIDEMVEMVRNFAEK